MYFLNNFYFISKDEKIKHEVFGYTIKRITKAGFLLPGTFYEVFAGIIKNDYLNIGKCLKLLFIICIKTF